MIPKAAMDGNINSLLIFETIFCMIRLCMAMPFAISTKAMKM